MLCIEAKVLRDWTTTLLANLMHGRYYIYEGFDPRGSTNYFTSIIAHTH